MATLRAAGLASLLTDAGPFKLGAVTAPLGSGVAGDGDGDAGTVFAPDALLGVESAANTPTPGKPRERVAASAK